MGSGRLFFEFGNNSVVLDTNVVVSAHLSTRGFPKLVWDLALASKYQFVSVHFKHERLPNVSGLSDLGVYFLERQVALDGTQPEGLFQAARLTKQPLVRGLPDVLLNTVGVLRH